MKNNRISFLVVLTLILSFQTLVFADIPQDSFRILALHEKDIIVPAVYQYNSKILELQQDRLNLQKDKEWVNVKMLHIQDQKRLVPSELKEASEIFSYKMELISKEIIRLTNLNRKHIESLRKLDNKVKSRHNNRAPTWWRLDDWVMKLLYSDSQTASINSGTVSVATEKKISNNRGDAKLIKDIKEKIKAVELGNWVELFSDESRLRLEVQLPILFGSGKSTIAKDYKNFFRKLSWLLKPYPVNIEVAGFTDGNAISGGKYTTNIELGVSRATNVVKELVNTGLKQSSFKIISQGEKPYKNTKNNKLSAAMKRRVEVNVFFGDNEA